jgi:hypothetical protein
MRPLILEIGIDAHVSKTTLEDGYEQQTQPALHENRDAWT